MKYSSILFINLFFFEIIHGIFYSRDRQVPRFILDFDLFEFFFKSVMPPTRHPMGCQARVSHLGTGTLQPFFSQS